MGRLTEEQKAQIPVLYEELGVQARVAEKLGISTSTVSRYVKKYREEKVLDKTNSLTVEEPKSAEPKQKIEITPELEEQINQYYSYCMNIVETARYFNFSTSIIKAHLSKENLELSLHQSEDKDALYDYIVHLFKKEPVSNWNIIQMEKFKKQGINYKAQLLILKYWYEVKGNNTDKSNGSIGIISYIANDAKHYYLSQLQKKKDTEKAIQKQLTNDRQTINYNPKDYWSNPKKKIKEIDLSTIEGSD